MCYRLWCQISCPPENIGFINHVVGDSKKASNIVLESGLPRLIFGKQGRHIGSHISCTPPLLVPLSILQHPGKALGLGGLASCGGPVSSMLDKKDSSANFMAGVYAKHVLARFVREFTLSKLSKDAFSMNMGSDTFPRIFFLVFLWNVLWLQFKKKWRVFLLKLAI